MLIKWSISGIIFLNVVRGIVMSAGRPLYCPLQMTLHLDQKELHNKK